MIRYEFPVPGTDLRLGYTRDEDGRLLELRCGARVHARRDGDALILGADLARVTTAAAEDGFDRTVDAAGLRWTESYRWDADGRLAHVDGVEVRRDAIGRVVACVDGATTWRYGYAGDDLAVINGPDGVRHLTAGLAGRPVLVRADGHRRRIEYDRDGRRAPVTEPPATWRHDESGRLWTVLDSGGRVVATYLWDGAACLGRIDGPPDEPLDTAYSLDPSGTPVRLISRSGVSRVPRDAFGEALLAHHGAPGLFGGAVHNGLVRLPARALDPRLGAFCAADPYHGGPDDPRRDNGFPGELPVETATGAYAVCRHDPVGRTDPSGAISWWLPVSDFTWGLQNNLLSLLGLDLTVNWWGSLFRLAPGRFFHFRGLSASDRIGSYAIMRDGVFAGDRAFTYAHTMYMSDEGARKFTEAELFNPTAAFTPTYYGSVLRLARTTGATATERPLLLRADRTLADPPLDWQRGGGPATPAIPGSAVPVFPSGGFFFDQPGAQPRPLVALTDATLTELVPAGTPAAGSATVAPNGEVTVNAALAAPGAVAARVQQYGVATLAALAAAAPTATFAGGVAAGSTVTFAGAGAATPGPVRVGQVVLVNGAPAVVAKITVNCTVDRIVTGPAGTVRLSRLGTTGPGYDASRLAADRVAVAPTVTSPTGATRTQFPRFAAGELVQVAWSLPAGSASPAGPAEYAVNAADGSTLTLAGGQSGLPADGTAFIVTRLVPQSSGVGGVFVALGGTGLGPASANVSFDLWQADDAATWATAGTLLAVSDGSTSRPVRMTAPATPAWSMTMAAPLAAAGAATVTVPPAPAATRYFATTTVSATNTVLADPMPGGAAPSGANLVLVTGFAPTGAPAAGRLESAGSRVPEATEDFELDVWAGLVDHELMHTKQSQRLGPWLLCFFPMALFELGRLVPALRDFDMPEYSAFVTGELAATAPGRRVLTLSGTAGVSFGSGDSVQLWAGSGQPTVVELGTADGANRFVVNVSGVGPDGPVQVRKVNTGTGLSWYRGFYNLFSLFTHGGMMNFVGGTVWGGFFWLVGRGIEAISRAVGEVTCPGEIDDPNGVELHLRPTGSDAEKQQLLAKFRGARRILIKKDDSTLLRELTTDSDPPLLKLTVPTTVLGTVTVSLDTSQGSVWDGYEYFPVSVPDPSVPGAVKVEPAGGKTLTLHQHDRVTVEFAEAAGSGHGNSVNTYVTAVRPDGLVELQDPPFLDGRLAAIGRIARISESDPAGWWDSWIMEKAGMGWMRWLFDPLGQLTLRTRPERDSAGEIFLRAGRYLLGSKSWSALPALGYFEWDNLFKQIGDNGYRSTMEQEASKESGNLYSSLGRLRIAPQVVGDIGRYWYFVSNTNSVLPNGGQDSPGVGLPQVPTVLARVTPETGSNPPFNRGAQSGARTPVAGAPDDPGGCVPDVFFTKAAGGEPGGPGRSYQFTAQGAIPLGPATGRAVGVHVAFCRPGAHRITMADGMVTGETESRDAQDRNVATVYYDVAITDVTVSLGGLPVTEGATVTLLATQRARLVVTPGPGRTHVLTVVQPADGPIRTADDGATLVAATTVNGAPVEVSRRYRPGADGVHTEGGLAGRRVHLTGDVHVPVREFAVNVTTTLPVRSAPGINPANPADNEITTIHPGQPVFLVLPVSTTGPPAVAPPGAVAAPTIEPVDPIPAGLVPFIGDGTALRLTFTAPAAPTQFTLTVQGTIPGSADPPVALTTATLTLEPT